MVIVIKNGCACLSSTNIYFGITCYVCFITTAKDITCDVGTEDIVFLIGRTCYYRYLFSVDNLCPNSYNFLCNFGCRSNVHGSVTVHLSSIAATINIANDANVIRDMVIWITVKCCSIGKVFWIILVCPRTFCHVDVDLCVSIHICL